jgi:uncharacterized protein YdhG (YjbR/CyaY superfamily)
MDRRVEVDRYLARVDPKLRRLLGHLRATILREAPGSEELVSYGIPAVRNQGLLLYYGAFEKHASLFVASHAVLARFERELRPFRAGKGTVRFGPERPLPDGLVRRIVRARLRENRARATRRARAS